MQELPNTLQSSRHGSHLHLGYVRTTDRYLHGSCGRFRKVEMALKSGNTSLQNNIRDITANINSCL